MQYSIEFENVTAKRGKNIIWTDGNFKIPMSGITAIIGPNGSGKTTLAELVLGIIPPAEGNIKVLSEPAGTINNQIGYVPQNYSSVSMDYISVYDFIRLNLLGDKYGIFKTQKDEKEKIEKALSAVDMLKYAGRRISHLSGGQRQRVSIAGAIVGNPKILILDEPLANLDIKNQMKVVDLIERINRELQITIFVVAHDLNPLLHILSGAIYLLDAHAHYDKINGIVDKDLLSHLYGTDIKVLSTPQGDLYMKAEGNGRNR